MQLVLEILEKLVICHTVSYLYFVHNSLEPIVFGEHSNVLSHKQLIDIASFYINIAKYIL